MINMIIEILISFFLICIAAYCIDQFWKEWKRQQAIQDSKIMAKIGVPTNDPNYQFFTKENIQDYWGVPRK